MKFTSTSAFIQIDFLSNTVEICVALSRDTRMSK